jgi:hypothetical protein
MSPHILLPFPAVWDEWQVLDWLEEVGMSHIIDKFHGQRITGEVLYYSPALIGGFGLSRVCSFQVLFTLTPNDLCIIGINSLGDRRKLLLAIRKLGGNLLHKPVSWSLFSCYPIEGPTKPNNGAPNEVP